MQYKQKICTLITVYPALYKNEYFDFIKEKINNWIFECFNAYNDFFTINVEQPSGIAKFYEYNKETDGSNIQFDKLWKSPYGSYNIFIEGSGDIFCGASNKLNPPKELMELSLNSFNFKYKEYSSIDGLRILTFGKDSGLPCEYTSNCSDIEAWKPKVDTELNCISYDWKIALHVSKDIFDYVFNTINKLIEANCYEQKYITLNIDEEEGYIETFGIYKIDKTNKMIYLTTCQELTTYLIQDDTFEIDELSMNFMAKERNKFYMEKYSFNDFSGKFVRKSISL